VTEVAALFTATPRFVTNDQADAGHNLSLGHSAPDYHRGVFAFADECLSTTTDSTTNTDLTTEAK